MVQMVGAAGFEPTTCSTQNCRATRLRYTPMSSQDHCCGVTTSLHGRDARSKPQARPPGARSEKLNPKNDKAPDPGALRKRSRRSAQCEESAGDPASGWISAAIIPLEPGP